MLLWSYHTKQYKGEFLMTNILERGVDFNSNISFCDDGTRITNDAGLLLMGDFLHHLDFEQMVLKALPNQEWRRSPKHQFSSLLTQLLLQKIAGYQKDSMTKNLARDPALKLCLNKNILASQPTVSRFVNHLDPSMISGFEALNLALNERLIRQTNQTDMIIDVDSTHSDTFGDQVNAAFNSHYASTGLHPLLAFDGLSGMFLGAKLRPGNVYTSTGVADFLRPIIDYTQKFSCQMNTLIRGDSGFATPELYQLCLSSNTDFLIKLKANAKLLALAESCAQTIAPEDASAHFFNLNYRAASWPESWRLRVVLKATRPAGELLCHYEFLVTTLTELSCADLFRMYHNRGVAENFIKEAKDGFGFDKTNSHSFQANTTRMWLAVLSYTLSLLFKRLVLPNAIQTTTIGTLRFWLLHIAGRVTTHARKILIHLSRSNPYIKLFWDVLYRIHRLD